MTQPAQEPSRDSIKKAAADRNPRPKRALVWSEVLGALEYDEARSYALDLYRRAGWTPDSFGRLTAAREAMADALTRTEDWLENWRLERPARSSSRDAARLRIRDLRRRLELWP